MPNFGLLEEVQLDPRAWRVGSITGASREVLNKEGDYSNFLPTDEYQIGVYFDTLACVTFSALNNLETIFSVQNKVVNFSDRFTATVSGTTHQGNFMSNVADSIRFNGVVPEEVWSYPRLQRTPVFTWDDFYTEPSPDVLAIGKTWLIDWDVGHEWVPTDPQTLIGALKWGPIQVTVYAWPNQVNGVYPDDKTQPRNHAVMLYKADGTNWYIFDSYDNTRKKLEWNYTFGAAKRFSLTKRQNMPTLNLPDDTLVQEVEKSGSFGLYLNGKIIVGDEGKLLASWFMRNKGDVSGKCNPIKLADWNSIPKQDLKGNQL